jgi:hypothetical protein
VSEKSSFNTQSPSFLSAIREALFAWLSSWYHWVNRCMLWVLCWLTVVLGPPATFALFYAAFYNIHGAELPSIGEMARAARGYFWQSWLWMLANAAVGALLWLVYRAGGTVVHWIAFLAGILWLAGQFYALPRFILQDEKNLLQAEREGFALAFSMPLFTLAVYGLALAVGLCSLVLVAPLPMGGPALVTVLATQAAFEREKKRG